ncbi:hypothetical protein CC78DRAFT_578959 [Lojkania enalia]|uniref:Tubulin-specific chaperone D C-terminal domain-containing protein n=1 Tax=Lojkania enalia TaxID=147567 RepID=A0A9P4KBS8_9PLEO|nr:hypothetical protein CC78DRAFT_578959 [Didymosphaeria enalia]
MNATEDEDLKLQRASAALISDLEKWIPKILWKQKQDSNLSEVHQRVRERDMFKIFGLIDPFQEDPQLLDSHLKTFIPPLVAAYLDLLHVKSKAKAKKHSIPMSHAICQILNLFCKVRGEKVIKGFLNNEPRYLEPILHAFEKGENFIQQDGEPMPQYIVPWAERYILLLWLSHLMLAPFPLASMSALQSSEEMSTALGITLPPEMPGVALRVLSICLKGIQSATKERSAAANLLVRLCVRPDMQKLGLLDTLVNWSLSFFSRISDSLTDIHQCLGVLSFISGLVSSATNDEIGPFIPAIYRSCQNIISQGTLIFIRSSAVARKLVVKTLRNIVVHCLQARATLGDLDSTTLLEEVIEFLLEALADGDTPVRYAASKALSIITMRLDPEMAGEVVDAILGCLNENVYWQGSKRNLSGVNPLKWHGLTLTLSHLLYRRAISASQLPDILNALLLGLTFEQRSAIGGSIGTNVRDAACFGIWALSRRYATSDLLAVETLSIRASQHRRTLSVPQVLAIELLVVACLDPAGNIRRGSSAALQELIGRHPNTVQEGIPLVQIVDFHAIGLRDRAMRDVAIKAASLHQMYWDALFESLLGWRATGSLDAPSREHAAIAIGLLSKNQSSHVIHEMAERICAALRELKPREVEERQGIVLSLSSLVSQSLPSEQSTTSTAANISKATDLTYLWKLFHDVLNLESVSFTSPALRPEYTASSICSFLGKMAATSIRRLEKPDPAMVPTSVIVRLLDLCLGRHEVSVLEAIPDAARGIVELLSRISPTLESGMILGWLTKLENEASYNGLRCSGYAIALGAVYPLLGSTGTTDQQMRTIEILTFRCTSAVAIEARTMALQALGVLLTSHSYCMEAGSLVQDVKDRIARAIHTALNDYTITERGDVGSLVRLEALSAIGTAWSTGSLQGSLSEKLLHTDVLRLSLEKLDKVRARAADVLRGRQATEIETPSSNPVESVSSYTYFSNALSCFHTSTSSAIKDSVMLGFISSAGMGSESVVQNSRAALLNAVDTLPTTSINDEEFSLQACVTCLTDLMKQNLEIERILLSLMEVFAFLFDMQVMHRLVETTFNFRLVLSLTQKAHFKSTNMHKLHLALDLYRGLGTIPGTRIDTISKVSSMLLHPFPKIRISAAETLWVLTQEDGLKRRDWSLPSKSLKAAVDGIKSSLNAQIQ